MSSILLAPPAAEPLTLAEAKAFLRVETAEDDALIAALIAAARLHVETQAGLALITQGWRMVLDCWPGSGRITVRPGPLRALTGARVFDFDGEAHALDTQAFVPDAGASSLAFMPWALPVPTRLAAGIELDVTVGFGDAAADVPEPLRQAIRLLAAHWYENRAAVPGHDSAPLPPGAAALIAAYRMPAL
ncbi:MAG TPA: head-tail connector protein [Pseudolabrys sp.]|nr:head-tail connector protein [Pseudolabrys sp.]